jgi:hypothetical protein
VADKGATGADRCRVGADGVVGSQGGAVSIEYTFDDTTANSDPGERLSSDLNNATENASTVIRADHSGLLRRRLVGRSRHSRRQHIN